MQLKTSKTIYSFHENFKKKFKFKEYGSLEEPTVFFGIYSNHDVNAVINHKGAKIVWFAGTDATYADKLEALKKSGATFIAESKWIEDDLKRVSIEYIPLTLFMDDLYVWKPEPLGDSLYWYGGNNSRYGKLYVNQVREAFPDLDIIITDNNSYSCEQMPEVYKKCFAGVRMVEHDGFSKSVGEMALMGRKTIWNGNVPFSVGYNNVFDVIKSIKELRDKKDNYKLTAKRARNFFLENERKWCDMLLEKFGTDEIDYAGIFEEAKGRCGSIFRLMRKEVADSLPEKLGLGQYERPYMSEQLDRLGLKQIITSKNSGFIASEWKGAGAGISNKGYKDGVKTHTYDKKYK